MKINVIRGQNQIGGSIIEISTANTSVILDVGINLDEGEKVEIPNIDGLFCGAKKYDAIFVSHYHSDHIGLLDYILDGIPVYMGERAYRIVKAASEYRNKEIKFSPNYLYDRASVVIGDIKIAQFISLIAILSGLICWMKSRNNKNYQEDSAIQKIRRKQNV